MDNSDEHNEYNANSNHVDILTEFLQTTLIVDSNFGVTLDDLSPGQSFLSFYDHGIALLKQKKWKEAAIFLEGAIQINVNSNAYLYLCVAWIKMGYFQRGIQFLNQMEDRAKKSIPLSNSQSKLSNLSDDRTSSHSPLREPLQTQSAPLRALDLKRFSLHTPHTRRNQASNQESKDINNVNNPSTSINANRIVGRHRRRSIDLLADEIGQLPPLLRQSHFYFMKGIFYHRLGNMTQAIVEASKAILFSLGKSAVAHMLKGDSLKFLPSLGKKELRYYRKAIKLNPKLSPHIGKGFRDDWDWTAEFDTFIEEYCADEYSNSLMSANELKKLFTYEDAQGKLFLKKLSTTLNPPPDPSKMALHHSFLEYEEMEKNSETDNDEFEDKVTEIVAPTRKRKSVQQLDMEYLNYIFEEESKRNYRTIWNEPNGYQREKQRETAMQHRIQHFALSGYKTTVSELRTLSPQRNSNMKPTSTSVTHRINRKNQTGPRNSENFMSINNIRQSPRNIYKRPIAEPVIDAKNSEGNSVISTYSTRQGGSMKDQASNAYSQGSKSKNQSQYNPQTQIRLPHPPLGSIPHSSSNRSYLVRQNYVVNKEGTPSAIKNSRSGVFLTETLNHSHNSEKHFKAQHSVEDSMTNFSTSSTINVHGGNTQKRKYMNNLNIKQPTGTKYSVNPERRIFRKISEFHRQYYFPQNQYRRILSTRVSDTKRSKDTLVLPQSKRADRIDVRGFDHRVRAQPSSNSIKMGSKAPNHNSYIKNHSDNVGSHVHPSSVTVSNTRGIPWSQSIPNQTIQNKPSSKMRSLLSAPTQRNEYARQSSPTRLQHTRTEKIMEDDWYLPNLRM